MPSMDFIATLPRIAMTDAPQNHGFPRPVDDTAVDDTTTVRGGTAIGGRHHRGVG